MAVLDIVYRSKKISSYEDNYGGNVFDNSYYSYVLFKDNRIFLFYSSPMYSASNVKPITSFNDSKTIKNIKIILKNASNSIFEKIAENKIKFSLPVQVVDEHGVSNEVNRIYTIVIENMSLVLNAFNENDPDKIVLCEEYERIDLKAE